MVSIPQMISAVMMSKTTEPTQRAPAQAFSGRRDVQRIAVVPDQVPDCRPAM